VLKMEQILVQPEQKNQQIIQEDLSAMASLAKEAYAISTPKRFKQFCLEDKIECLDFEFVQYKECIVHNGKVFELVNTFKQTGYCARHIGDRLDQIRRQGKEPLIVNLPRNKRLVFASL